MIDRSVPVASTWLACNVDVLDRIQRRVLWLAVRMIHEANAVRPNPDGTKVGGHQASSASVVSVLTALYFGGWLRPGDRVSIKSHASPAFHAGQYLLGNLDPVYLHTLRQFGGLQAYPSRTKDPDAVDFSTGSVGLGATAPLFAALTERYTASHFRTGDAGPWRRYVALVGDAELDEGNIWEAITDETVRAARLGNLLWIVDLNRQSLDRVIPGIKVQEMQALFGAVGWQVLEAKYGRRLQAAFARPGGVALRRRIDDMSNEDYQDLVRVDHRQPGDPPVVHQVRRHLRRRAAFATRSSRRQLACGQVALKMCGKRHWLWRAVDQNGVVLDILLQSRRDQQAAESFVRQVVDGVGYEPRVVVTDRLASYPPAIRSVLPNTEHRRHKRLNNGEENSHLPTRKRERVLRRFKSAEHAQRFPGIVTAVSP